MTFIVTIKLGRRSDHNPHDKKWGKCRVNADHRVGPPECTDRTGEHHSFLIDADCLEAALKPASAKYNHVTRVEEARWA